MAKVATGHAVCDTNEDEGGIFTGWSGMQSPTFESVHEGVIDDAPPPAVQRQPTLASFFGMPTSQNRMKLLYLLMALVGRCNRKPRPCRLRGEVSQAGSLSF
jgi:hypothetical protein